MNSKPLEPSGPSAEANQSLRDFLRSEAVAKRLQALRTPSASRFIAAVLFNYGIIAAAITCATLAAGLIDSPILCSPVWLGAVVVIAARQHALLVLMHEGAHRTVSRNRALNDVLSDLLCGAPLLVSTRTYRRAHLAHHQHLNSGQDPDWCRKVDNKADRDQWLFPARVPLWRLLGTLYGHSVLYLLKSLADNQKAGPEPEPSASSTPQRAPTPSDSTLAAAKYALYAVAGLLITLTDAWTGFALYWLAPMLLVLPLIMRIRSIAEHFALRHDHPLRQTRTVRAGWLERLLLAPHHIGLHIDHHLQAAVPFYQLPRLHCLLLKCPEYRNNAHLNDGYFLTARTGTKSLDSPPPRALFATDLYGPPSEVLQPSNGAQPSVAKVAAT